MRSRFVERCKLAKSTMAFEEWLKLHDYKLASEHHVGAIHAAALVEDFLDDCYQYTQHARQVMDHADDIGYVSDAQDHS